VFAVGLARHDAAASRGYAGRGLIDVSAGPACLRHGARNMRRTPVKSVNSILPVLQCTGFEVRHTTGRKGDVAPAIKLVCLASASSSIQQVGAATPMAGADRETMRERKRRVQ